MHFLALQVLKLLKGLQSFHQKFLRLIFLIVIFKRIEPLHLHRIDIRLSILCLNFAISLGFQFLHVLVEQNILDLTHREFLAGGENLHDFGKYSVVVIV